MTVELDLEAWRTEYVRHVAAQPDSSARVRTCPQCRAGEHVDHQQGVWRRADGSDPVVCRCPRCTPNAPLQLQLI